ncbi:hypothetical protein HYFRA_00007769 [Hymenoscyphus fraxineus]|uniref:Uncharacterized protein n=1 Tax=Hymenoscyphus fraxineus TaxID=746836 RepID=A0A9N9PPK3_9HELO|nr:hypothetical protein HYFRA_00007769 [Hymenoscyphus fraxineus]
MFYELFHSILSYLFFETTTMSGSGESSNTIREQLQQCISPFARIGTIGSSNSLGDLVITLSLSNNVFPRSFRQREFPYKGKFNYRDIVDHATKIIFQHSSGQSPTYGMVEGAVSSFLTQSLQDYEKNKSLEARLKSSSRSNFKPDACHMVIRIHKGSQVPCRLENHYWHVDNHYKPESPGDVNSLYAITFLGKPTLVLKPQSTLPPSIKREAEKVSTGLQIFSESRRQLNEEIRNSNLRPNRYLETVKVGDIIRFTCGRNDSPIHAAGDINGTSDRIFMLIYFGSAKEIKLL